MPADALTYSLCTKELNSILSGAKINKISMPQHDTLIFNVRAQGKNVLLTLSANASFPRVHLTVTTKENPPVAPSFLMHLRKHINGGIIENVSCVPFERIVIIKIKAMNELMIAESKKLIIEIMGKHSNIILVNQNGVISDSIKHITHDVSAKRQVLPGLPYNHPPIQAEKTNAFETAILKQKLLGFEGDNLEKFLLSQLSGLASGSIKEVVFRANIPSNQKLSENDVDKIITEFNSLYDLEKAKPCCLKHGDLYQDFFITPYQSYLSETQCDTNDKKSKQAIIINNELKFIYFDSLNQAMDAFYSSHFLRQVSVDKCSFLLAIIKSNLNKCQKKLGSMMQTQHEAMDYENDRKIADLILSNIYKIRKGDSEIEVNDFYNDNEPLRITIDSHKTPQANAQAYYKKYNKKKTALQKLEPFIADLNSGIEHLNDLAYFAESAESEIEFTEITDELIRLGYLKRKENTKKSGEQNQVDRSVIEYQGYRIHIGKSSTGNDALVRKSASTSVWLHASNIPGSHVVIENYNDNLPPSEVLIYAAQLAAHFSKARHSENVPVDYTFIKNIKKPKGAPPGKVTFTQQKTIFVTPKKP